MAAMPLPNPDTPLAFLPPTLAAQYEVSRYIYVASLGAFIWDILTALPEEYQLLFKQKKGLSTLVYFLSRFGTMAYIVTNTVFQISTVGNCQSLQVAIGWCFVWGVGTTSLLFFFRVAAIFDRMKTVIFSYFFLWLAVIAFSITVPFSIGGGHIGTTKYCINTKVKPLSSSALIVPTVHDSLVFIGISWRLIYIMTPDETFINRTKLLFGKGNLPTISKTLLQSGQQYYVIMLASNLLTSIMVLAPQVPPVYHAMFTIPNVALMNSMACRVFRAIKFGTLKAKPTTTLTTKTSLPTRWQRYGNTPSTAISDFDPPITIEITKTIDQMHDNLEMEIHLPKESSHSKDLV